MAEPPFLGKLAEFSGRKRQATVGEQASGGTEQGEVLAECGDGSGGGWATSDGVDCGVTAPPVGEHQMMDPLYLAVVSGDLLEGVARELITNQGFSLQ